MDRQTHVRYTGTMDQLCGIERAAALLGVHPDTIRRRERQGKIRVLRTPGGKRRIAESEIRRLRGQSFSLPQRVLAIYGRVSSHEQKAKGDLDRQVAHIRAAMAGQGLDRIIEVTDVASGLSDRRRGLLRLMEMARPTWR
jgi:putative resolvase